MNVIHLRSDPSYRCITCKEILQFTFHSMDNALLLPAWCPECDPDKQDLLKEKYDEHEAKIRHDNDQVIKRAYEESMGLMSLHSKSLHSTRFRMLLNKHPELIKRLSMNAKQLRKVYSQ